MGTEVLKQPHQFHASLSALQTVELPHSSNSKAVVFGNNIDVYKSGNDVLNVDDAAVSVNYNGGKNTLRLPNTTAGVGITIGGDTNLYRSAANTLKTDNSFTVADTLSAQGIIYTQEQQVVKTPTTTMPGNSAVTSIIAVSAIPVTPEIGTLYILV